MKLSLVTIGQAPRTDFNEFLKENSSIIIEQIGILDEYKNDFPNPVTDNILVSRLKDGGQVQLDKSFAVEKVKDIIAELEQGDTDIILLACTGEFEFFDSTKPIIYPDKLVGNIISTVFDEKICVLVPDKKQMDYIIKKWDKIGIDTVILDISPYNYTEDDIDRVAEELNDIEINHVICDCMGYNLMFKNELQKRTNKNIILSNEVVFSNIFALIS